MSNTEPEGRTHPKHPGFFEEEGVFPQGPYTAWTTPDGTIGLVLARGVEGKVVKRFRGETAHMDAVRYTGDLNRDAGW